MDLREAVELFVPDRFAVLSLLPAAAAENFDRVIADALAELDRFFAAYDVEFLLAAEVDLDHLAVVARLTRFSRGQIRAEDLVKRRAEFLQPGDRGVGKLPTLVRRDVEHQDRSAA